MRQREGRKWSCDVLYVKTPKKKPSTRNMRASLQK